LRVPIRTEPHGARTDIARARVGAAGSDAIRRILEAERKLQRLARRQGRRVGDDDLGGASISARATTKSPPVSRTIASGCAGMGTRLHSMSEPFLADDVPVAVYRVARHDEARRARVASPRRWRAERLDDRARARMRALRHEFVDGNQPVGHAGSYLENLRDCG
jgi:hypothetical protein